MSDISANKLILLGCGGHAAVVAQCALRAGMQIIGALDDDDTSPPIPYVEYCGSLEQLESLLEKHTGAVVHAAVGNGQWRQQWLAKIETSRQATIIDPSAIVAESAQIGCGCFIGPGAIVNARAKLGDGAIVNSGAIVEHDCQIGQFAHVAPGAVLAGDVCVGELTLIGLNATVRPAISLGKGVVVGAGAVVVHDAGNDLVLKGVPAT